MDFRNENENHKLNQLPQEPGRVFPVDRNFNYGFFPTTAGTFLQNQIGKMLIASPLQSE
jgi:hypothetical protein